MLLLISAARGQIVREVRAAIAMSDFAAAERQIAAYRGEHGVTPELAEAVSWMARGALAVKRLDDAGRYAGEARKLALGALDGHNLDSDPNAPLPIALGASIEVQAQAMAQRGERDQAVSFLRAELKRWRKTSIRARIQKNLNLLMLEGKPAPPIQAAEWLGAAPDLGGRPVLVFLWAHWCPDCKRMAPDLARIEREYGPRGLIVVAPTQLYGYTRRGQDASRKEEVQYIDEMRRTLYGGFSVPVSDEIFKSWGASTTPTLALIDARGLVRLYHPGQMTYGELAKRIEEMVKPAAKAASAR